MGLRRTSKRLKMRPSKAVEKQRVSFLIPSERKEVRNPEENAFRPRSYISSSTTEYESSTETETIVWAGGLGGKLAKIAKKETPACKIKRRGASNIKHESMIPTSTATAPIGTMDSGQEREKERKMAQLEREREQAWEENGVIQQVRGSDGASEALEMLDAAFILLRMERGV